MTDVELLKLPFDQYQRYQVTVDLLAALHARPRSRLLEVGGAPAPVESFLQQHDIVVVDIEGKRSGRYALADGSRLPFSDRTFDIVIALDTLEHVPASRRPSFLSEMRRVSRDLVVISAPFANADVVLAEDALNSFVRHRFGGDFPTLDEHREHGLPQLEAVISSITAAGWAYAVLPSGYLPRWLLGMLFHHELLATGLPDLPDIHAYYNATVSPLDARAPAYRSVIVAGRSRPAHELEAAARTVRSQGDEGAARVALGSIASAVLARRLPLSSPENRALEASIEALDRRVADLERQVADREAHIVELRMANDRLSAERDDANRRLLEELRNRGVLGLARRASRSLRGWDE